MYNPQMNPQMNYPSQMSGYQQHPSQMSGYQQHPSQMGGYPNTNPYSQMHNNPYQNQFSNPHQNVHNPYQQQQNQFINPQNGYPQEHPQVNQLFNMDLKQFLDKKKNNKQYKNQDEDYNQRERPQQEKPQQKSNKSKQDHPLKNDLFNMDLKQFCQNKNKNVQDNKNNVQDNKRPSSVKIKKEFNEEMSPQPEKIKKKVQINEDHKYEKKLQFDSHNSSLESLQDYESDQSPKIKRQQQQSPKRKKSDASENMTPRVTYQRRLNEFQIKRASIKNIDDHTSNFLRQSIVAKDKYQDKKDGFLYSHDGKHVAPNVQNLYQQELEVAYEGAYYDHNNIDTYVLQKGSENKHYAEEVVHSNQNQYLRRLEQNAEVQFMKNKLYNDQPEKIFIPPIRNQTFLERQQEQRLVYKCRDIVKRIQKEADEGKFCSNQAMQKLNPDKVNEINEKPKSKKKKRK